MDNIGQRLREERQLRGWSQRDLARETGVNTDTISGIETSQHEPRPSTLRKLAEGLGIEVRDLFAEPALGKAEAPRGAGPPEEVAAAASRMAEQVAEGASAAAHQVSEQTAGSAAPTVDERHPSIFADAVSAAADTWAAAVSNPEMDNYKRFGIRDAAIELFERINARAVEEWRTLPNDERRDIGRAMEKLNEVPEQAYRAMPDETLEEAMEERRKNIRELTRRISA